MKCVTYYYESKYAGAVTLLYGKGRQNCAPIDWIILFAYPWRPFDKWYNPDWLDYNYKSYVQNSFCQIREYQVTVNPWHLHWRGNYCTQFVFCVYASVTRIWWSLLSKNIKQLTKCMYESKKKKRKHFFWKLWCYFLKQWTSDHWLSNTKCE